MTRFAVEMRTDSAAEPRTVLVVDDDQGLVRLIEKALQREALTTASAGSATEARAWLSRHIPRLMLLDLKLPDLEGNDLVQELTRLEHCPPFIIITGQGDERVAVEMMKRGARDYLVKDASFLELVPAVVKRALEQIENERRLAEAVAERKRLEKEILEISDRERRRIGQDLHDGLCQHLAGIELMSQVLEQKLASRSKADAARAGEIARHVRDAIGQTRSLARGLSPVTLEAEGLASALIELGASTEKLFGVECRVECREPVTPVPLSTATQLYRIAQEAVSNAIKHGKAKTVLVRLATVAEQVVLTIGDNGPGFRELPPRQTGMGLRIMHYRAGIIGGILTMDNRPGGGAQVTCAVGANKEP